MTNTNIKDKFPIERKTYQNLEVITSERIPQLKKEFAAFSNTLAAYGGKIHGSREQIVIQVTQENHVTHPAFYIFVYYEVPTELKEQFYTDYILKRHQVRKESDLGQEIEKVIRKYTEGGGGQ